MSTKPSFSSVLLELSSYVVSFFSHVIGKKPPPLALLIGHPYLLPSLSLQESARPYQRWLVPSYPCRHPSRPPPRSLPAQLLFIARSCLLPAPYQHSSHPRHSGSWWRTLSKVEEAIKSNVDIGVAFRDHFLALPT